MSPDGLAFRPAFRSRFPEYSAEKKQVNSLEAWQAFDRKWFRESWPLRRGGAVANRFNWSSSFFAKDLCAEDRYEYFHARWTVGFPLESPHLLLLEKAARNGFFQACPYCEISEAAERVAGDDCPSCGRALLLTYTEWDDGPAD